MRTCFIGHPLKSMNAQLAFQRTGRFFRGASGFFSPAAPSRWDGVIGGGPSEGKLFFSGPPTFFSSTRELMETPTLFLR